MPCPQFHGGSCPYNNEGLLMHIHPNGLMECPKDCNGAGKGKSNLCRVSAASSPRVRIWLAVACSDPLS